MLTHYFDKGFAYSQYYDLNLKPVPNWFSHATMALMMKLVPPLAAEKILLTGYVILFVLAMLYFLRSTGDGREWLVFLAFPFTYNYLLHSGFYNFSISFPLVFLTIGYWWRRRDRALGWGWHQGESGRRGALGLNLLLILLYFCSILSLVLTMGSVLVLAALHYRGSIRRTLALAAAMIPSYLLPIYYITTQEGEQGGKIAAGHLSRYLAVIGSLTSYDTREDYVGASLAVLFAALIGYTLLAETLGLGKVGRRPSRMGLRSPSGPHPTGRFPRAGFLILAVGFLFLYFLAPSRAYGGGTITQRLSLYPFIAILPWLATRMPRRATYAVGAIAVCLTLAHVGFTVHYYRIFNRGLAEYTSGIPFVERNKSILPISFDHKGEAARIGVYRHAGSYYSVVRDAIDLANYEGDKTYFPLKYKASMNPWSAMGPIESARGNIRPERYPGKIAYVLLWSAPAQFPALEWIEANYDLIHSEGRLKLYRRRDESSE
jgi:hypothetical protein